MGGFCKPVLEGATFVNAKPLNAPDYNKLKPFQSNMISGATTEQRNRYEEKEMDISGKQFQVS